MCFCTCKNDSWYLESWKRNPNGDPVKFFHIPGTVRQNERQKWIKACHHGDSFVCMKDSYNCSLHFVSGNGPTKEDPDPISAVESKERVCLSICAFITLFVILITILYCGYVSWLNRKQLWTRGKWSEKPKNLSWMISG